MKIRVFEAFSGIGAQAMSLKRLQAEYPDMLDFEFVGTSEIEPSAIKAYTAVHGNVICYGDITKIEWSQVPDFDLFTMSSPCQDFSVAGRQAGAEEGSGTRSSLLWECRKAIIAKRPKYILFENVSAVVSKKFIRGFNKWQAELESYGYTNFAKVLNSKDYGCPQNRERLFMISILDCTKSYHFPEPFKLEKRIKDILEPYGTVDESFYFSPEQLLRIIAHCDRKVDEGCGFKTQFHTEDEISGCVTTRYGQRETDPCIKEGISIHPLNRKMEFKGFQNIMSDTAPCLTSHDGEHGSPSVLWEKTDRIIKLGNYTPRGTHAGTLVSVEGIAPTVMGQHGTVTGVVEPCILTPQRTEEAKELRRKGIEVFKHRELVPREDGVSNTITTVQKDNLLVEPTDRQSKIRSKVMPNGNIRFYQDDESKSGISEMQIIHPNNECPTITTAHVPKILEPVAVRMIGRNPDNPSDRSKGCPTEQRLEFGDNVANCITTVQKDSMVAAPMVGNDPRKAFDVLQFSDVCPTLLATVYKSPKLVREPIELSFTNLPDKTVLKDEDGRGYLWQDGCLWRVRKLVPIETARLMDVADEDFYKMQKAGISKTALYSLFGNSIVVNVLYHISRKLWIDTECESAQKSLFDF